MPLPSPILIYPDRHPPTIADLRQAWVNEYFNSRELAPNTRKAYEIAIAAFIQWTDKPWGDIKAKDIDRYKEELKTHYSAASVCQKMSALSSLFTWLCARDYIPKNPTVMMELPKVQPRSPQDWSWDEVQQLLNATQKRGETEPRDRSILWLLLHGLRAGEVSALNVGDFCQSEVYVRKAKRNKCRMVPLLKDAEESIAVYLHYRRMDEEFTEESPLMISVSRSNHGSRLAYSGIRLVMQEIGAITGMADVHPHRGRHTIASEMMRRGMPVELAMRITGHSSVRSYGVYADQAIGDLAAREFRERLGD
jgi:integrase/recombinase XerD